MILALLGLFSTCTAEEITSSAILPVKVIDGDSLEIGNNRIRLMGIDAPEYIQYCKNANKEKYKCGIHAKEHLEQIINNTPITCKVHKKDQYNRDLCTCYKGNTDINAEMVRSGHALVYLESPYQKQQEEAKQNKRGLWQGRFMHPRLFRRLKEQQKLN
jgi:endonuclease YncB( thermonuclease family)